jgi:hypothetical protein
VIKKSHCLAVFVNRGGDAARALPRGRRVACKSLR